MKFFAFITLTSALLLILIAPIPKKPPLSQTSKPSWLIEYKTHFIESFTNAKNGRLLWGFLTGDKKGVSQQLIKDFNQLELGYLFSPSGLHLSAFIALLGLVIKRGIYSKKISPFIKLTTLAAYTLPFLAIKRVVIFKLLFYLKQRFKLRISTQMIFFATFALSLILGHFLQSPQSFVMSYLFVGTFIGLKDYSKMTLILGLASGHLLLAFFMKKNLSLLALILSLPLIGISSLLISLGYLYLLTFKGLEFNWIEKLVQYFLALIKEMSKISHSFESEPKILIFVLVWLLLLKQKKRYICITLFLCAGSALAPSVFYSATSTLKP